MRAKQKFNPAKARRRLLKLWSLAVRTLDQHQCQLCGRKDRRLNAAHIVPKAVCRDKRLWLALVNGVTLCAFPCHQLVFDAGGDREAGWMLTVRRFGQPELYRDFLQAATREGDVDLVTAQQLEKEFKKIIHQKAGDSTKPGEVEGDETETHWATSRGSHPRHFSSQRSGCWRHRPTFEGEHHDQR